jgi:hypothetical protein
MRSPSQGWMCERHETVFESGSTLKKSPLYGVAA